MNKTIKKIVAFGLGATMLCGTAAMAFGSTLADYPSPFVKEGAFVGKIVIGEKAATVDTIGALDIAASLQRASSSAVAGTAGTTAVASSGVSLASGTDQVYLGAALNTQRDTLTKDDLPTILADGTFVNDAGSDFDYEQTIDIGSHPTIQFATSDNDLDDPELILEFDASASTPLYTLEVTFDEAVNFTHADSEGEVLEIFGKEYTVGTDTDATYLQLLGGSTYVSVAPGETKTVVFNSQSYEITLHGVNTDGDEATFTINGETKKLTEGTTKTVGGLDVYLDTVSAFNTEANPGWAKIQLGAQELWLSTGDEVAVGTGKDAIDGTLVTFTGTTEALTKIAIAVAADDNDNDHLNIGDSFTDPVFGAISVKFANMPNGPMLNAEADENDDRKKVNIGIGDDEVLKITFEDASGNDATFEWAYNKALADKDGDNLEVYEAATLDEDDYFILNSGNYQHLVEVTKIDLSDDSTANDKVYLKDLFTGTTHKVEDKDFGAISDTTTFTISGQTYTLLAVNDTLDTIKIYSSDYGASSNRYVYPYLETVNDKDHRIAFFDDVTLTGVDASTTIELPTGSVSTATLTGLTNLTDAGTSNQTYLVGTVYYYFEDTATAGGLTVSVDADQSSSTEGGLTVAGVMFVEEDDNSNSDAKNALILYTTDGSSASYTALADPIFTRAAAGYDSNVFDDSDFRGYIDSFGTYYVKDSSDTYQTVGWFTYPVAQMYAQVFVTPVDATVSTTASTGAVSLNPIAVGMAITDTEATNLGTTPYIVVGGPCANTVAATLMGNPADCAEGFTEGKAKIKLFSSQNALLVAGGSGKDTQGACRVVSLYSSPDYKSKFTGAELEVITTNLNSLSVNTVQ